MAEVGGNQFDVDIDGVGKFTFLRRTQRLSIAVGVEINRLNEGVELNSGLQMFVEASATLKVLTKESPPGWDLQTLDPFEDADYATVLKVWSALRDKEIAFRQRPAPVVAGSGEAPGPDGGVLVPAEIQPEPDRPAVP